MVDLSCNKPDACHHNISFADFSEGVVLGLEGYGIDMHTMKRKYQLESAYEACPQTKVS